MTETPNQNTDDPLFFALITDLATQAWIALGKLKHPASDKIERNIPVARILIDMLDMLARKTNGNRTENEEHEIQDVLRQLKLNYLTESSKEAETPPEQPPTGPDVDQAPESAAAPETATEPQAKPADRKEPPRKPKEAAPRTTTKKAPARKAGATKKGGTTKSTRSGGKSPPAQQTGRKKT